MDKTRHGPVIALFSVKLQQLFSLRLKYPCINQPFFHCLLFDIMIGSYILAIQQMITHKEHLQYSFWSVAIFWTSLKALPWYHGHNNRRWLKQPQSHFYWAVPSKSCHFLLFWCMPCTATPDISSSRKNINSTTRVSRLSFRFLWLFFNI